MVALQSTAFASDARAWLARGWIPPIFVTRVDGGSGIRLARLVRSCRRNHPTVLRHGLCRGRTSRTPGTFGLRISGDDGIELPHEFKTPARWAEKHVLKPGDLLLARSGATVGKSYIHVAALDPAIYAGYCIRFRFKDVVLPEFVYSFTKTEPYAAWAAAISARPGSRTSTRRSSNP